MAYRAVDKRSSFLVYRAQGSPHKVTSNGDSEPVAVLLKFEQTKNDATRLIWLSAMLT